MKLNIDLNIDQFKRIVDLRCFNYECGHSDQDCYCNLKFIMIDGKGKCKAYKEKQNIPSLPPPRFPKGKTK